MKEKRKRFIQIFALVLIMLLIASSTYAYFAAQVSEVSSTDIIVNTSTVDSLTFETGEAISISATQSNFGSGAGNQSGGTYASATLVANNDTNSASTNYYLYIKIDTNEFEYTTSDKTSDLILTITDPDGNEVTSLSGLTYTSVTDGDGNIVSGFDITTKIGLITIAENYLIESTGTNTQEWNIEVTLVNLDSDQLGNAGKTFDASLVIQSTIYGNTLQAVSSSYSEKFWAYKSSITKIVFDDTGTTISDYEEVYDITDDGYCYYDGTEVTGVTRKIDECSSVYSYGSYYYTESYMNYYFYNGATSVSWDSENNVCVVDGLESGTYSLSSPNGTVSEAYCTGYAYQYGSGSYYYLGFEYVGSGEWIDADNYSSIQAYLVNNGDSTYTVYIESDAPILGNENMSYWFYNFTSLESIEGLDKLITSNVTTMEGMFYRCYSLITLDVNNFDTSNVTNMSYMFSYCDSLRTLDLSSFDTSNVTDMNNMFWAESMKLTYIDVSSFDTSQVINMRSMFKGCKYLSSLNLSSFDTSNVTDMSSMFYGCSSLVKVDMSRADFSNVTTYSYMFRNANSSITVTVKDSSAYDFITARLSEYNGGTVVIA